MAFVKVQNVTTPLGFWVTVSHKVGFLEGALRAQLSPSRASEKPSDPSPFKGDLQYRVRRAEVWILGQGCATMCL